MKMMYGMVADLLRRRVTDIFLPVLLESSRSTPPQVRLALPQVTAPYALKGVFPLRSTARGSGPRTRLSVPKSRLFERFGAGLGLPRGEVRRAFDAAERASGLQGSARGGREGPVRMREQGQGRRLPFRPYSSLDGGLNMGVPEVRKTAGRPAHGLPRWRRPPRPLGMAADVPGTTRARSSRRPRSSPTTPLPASTSRPSLRPGRLHHQKLRRAVAPLASPARSRDRRAHERRRLQDPHRRLHHLHQARQRGGPDFGRRRPPRRSPPRGPATPKPMEFLTLRDSRQEDLHPRCRTISSFWRGRQAAGINARPSSRHGRRAR